MKSIKGFVMMEALVALLLVGIALVPLSLGVSQNLLKKSPQKLFEANRVLEYQMALQWPQKEWDVQKELNLTREEYSHWFLEFREDKTGGLRCLIGEVRQQKKGELLSSLRRCRP
jgi:hypothetical protein